MSEKCPKCGADDGEYCRWECRMYEEVHGTGIITPCDYRALERDNTILRKMLMESVPFENLNVEEQWDLRDECWSAAEIEKALIIERSK